MASNTSGTMTTRKAAREAARLGGNPNATLESNPQAVGNSTTELNGTQLNGTQNGTLNGTAGNNTTSNQPAVDPFSKSAMNKMLRKLPKLPESARARVESQIDDLLLQEEIAASELDELEKDMIAQVKRQFEQVRNKTPSRLLNMQLSDLQAAGSKIELSEEFDFCLNIPRSVLIPPSHNAASAQGGDAASKKPARKPFPNEEVVVFSKHGTPLAVDDLNKTRVRIQPQNALQPQQNKSNSAIKVPSMPRIAQSARK